jgi:hypothetical protein
LHPLEILIYHVTLCCEGRLLLPRAIAFSSVTRGFANLVRRSGTGSIWSRVFGADEQVILGGRKAATPDAFGNAFGVQLALAPLVTHL